MSELIAKIYARCIEVGDCWEWQGAMQSIRHTPVMKYRGKTRIVRHLLLQDRGLDLEGKVCTYKCGNALCVNPEHLETISRQKLNKRITAQTMFQASTLRRARLATHARQHAKLTAELVEQIRQADGTQRAIAQHFGISQQTVSDIRRGRTWRDYSNPFLTLLKGRT